MGANQGDIKWEIRERSAGQEVGILHYLYGTGQGSEMVDIYL
jgi:hypothetical protein